MKIVHRLRHKLREYRAVGPAGLLIIGMHRLFKRRSAFFRKTAHLFTGHGLEIGGPSRFFSAQGYAPVYLQARALDNVNFAAATHWEGAIATGNSFHFREGAAPGKQFIHEAGELASIGDACYDFLVSCHMLEHSANPLRALREWKRVMRPGATLLLVLPHKDGTFDRYRPTTTLSHLEDDDRRGTAEDDRTHIPEVLALHDLTRDPAQASPETFRRWVEGNLVNRGVHHHVFDSRVAAELVDRAGFSILRVEPAVMESIYVFAQKPLDGTIPDNSKFTSARAGYLRLSPFRSDRRLRRG